MGFNMKPKSPLTKKLVSALKHKPWAAAHKERPAHSATAEAHNAEPAAPTKKYVSDAQRKAVHASKAEQSPAKKHRPGHGGPYPKPRPKPSPLPPNKRPKPRPPRKPDKPELPKRIPDKKVPSVLPPAPKSKPKSRPSKKKLIQQAQGL